MNILIGLVSIVIGAVVCFSGYRIFRVVLMLVGFLLGFVLGMAIMSNSGGIGQLLVGVVVGLLGAGIFYALYFVGIFLAGAFLGAGLAAMLVSLFNIGGGVATILVLVGLIGGAILALVLNKLMIVISTAFSGAGTMVEGAVMILPGVLGSAAATLNTSLLVSFNALGVIAWLALSVAGVVVQYRNNKADIESNKPMKG